MPEINWDDMMGFERLKVIRGAASRGDALTVYLGLISMGYGYDRSSDCAEAREAGISDLETLWRAGRELDRQVKR